MVLKGGIVLPSHSIAQLKPQLLLKLIALICSTDGVQVRVMPIYFSPSPELIHVHTIFRPNSPLIPRQLPSFLLAFQ